MQGLLSVVISVSLPFKNFLVLYFRFTSLRPLQTRKHSVSWPHKQVENNVFLAGKPRNISLENKRLRTPNLGNAART